MKCSLCKNWTPSSVGGGKNGSNMTTASISASGDNAGTLAFWELAVVIINITFVNYHRLDSHLILVSSKKIQKLHWSWPHWGGPVSRWTIWQQLGRTLARKKRRLLRRKRSGKRQTKLKRKIKVTSLQRVQRVQRLGLPPLSHPPPLRKKTCWGFFLVRCHQRQVNTEKECEQEQQFRWIQLNSLELDFSSISWIICTS